MRIFHRVRMAYEGGTNFTVEVVAPNTQAAKEKAQSYFPTAKIIRIS